MAGYICHSYKGPVFIPRIDWTQYFSFNPKWKVWSNSSLVHLHFAPLTVMLLSQSIDSGSLNTFTLHIHEFTYLLISLWKATQKLKKFVYSAFLLKAEILKISVRYSQYLTDWNENTAWEVQIHRHNATWYSISWMLSSSQSQSSAHFPWHWLAESRRHS